MFSNPAVLNLATLVLVLAIVVGAFLWFRRKPSNRNPMGDKGMEANHPVQDAKDRRL